MSIPKRTMDGLRLRAASVAAVLVLLVSGCGTVRPRLVETAPGASAARSTVGVLADWWATPELQVKVYRLPERALAQTVTFSASSDTNAAVVLEVVSGPKQPFFSNRQRVVFPRNTAVDPDHPVSTLPDAYRAFVPDPVPPGRYLAELWYKGRRVDSREYDVPASARRSS